MEEMDLELMISVTGGLGSWQQDEDGSARYCTTADTLGAHARTACLFLPAPRRGWRLGALSGRARRLPQGLAALPAARRPGQAGGLLCAGPVRGRPVRPRGHHHNISGGLRACVQRACAPTTSREPVARAAAPELRTGPKRKHSLRRAVKVVTFLTLPLELESESPALQVCCSDARLLTLSLFSASQAWLCHSTRRLSGSCTRAARARGCCPRRGAAARAAGVRRPHARAPPWQVEYMAAVKEAFLARDALAVVVALVAEPLQRHAAGRAGAADANTVQLVLTFLRNLVVLPDAAPTAGALTLPLSDQQAVVLSLPRPPSRLAARPRGRRPDEQAPRPVAPGKAMRCCQPRRCCRAPCSRGRCRVRRARGRCACCRRTPTDARAPGRAQARGARTGAACAGSCWSACWTTARWSCSRSWRSTPRGCGARRDKERDRLGLGIEGQDPIPIYPGARARRAHARAAAPPSHSLTRPPRRPPGARRR